MENAKAFSENDNEKQMKKANHEDNDKANNADNAKDYNGHDNGNKKRKNSDMTTKRRFRRTEGVFTKRLGVFQKPYEQQQQSTNDDNNNNK